ncbi:hypothetical protein S245_002797, partial [Arachis hypogaea]
LLDSDLEKGKRAAVGLDTSPKGIPKSNVKSMSLAAKKNNPYPDVKHTFLPILVKSLSMALTKYPSLNSCFKEDSMEVIFKGSHNIGVAMATPNGLVVPNIKNVRSLSILQVSFQSHDCFMHTLLFR